MTTLLQYNEKNTIDKNTYTLNQEIILKQRIKIRLYDSCDAYQK